MKRKIKSWIIAIVLSAIIAVTASCITAQESTGSISGRVVCERQSQREQIAPVPKAIVSVRSIAPETFGEIIATAITNVQGGFHIEGVAAGTYQVLINASGYLQRGWGWSQEVFSNSPARISPGQTTCTKGGGYAKGDIVLRPSQVYMSAAGKPHMGTLWGRVVRERTSLSEQIMPIARAQVTVVTKDGKQLAVTSTNAAGYFHIANLPGGSYRISLAAKDYLQRGWGWSQEVFSNSPAWISPGQTTSTKGGTYAQGDIVMRPSHVRNSLPCKPNMGALWGRVVRERTSSSEQILPLARVQVTVFTDKGKKAASASTNEAGYFHVINLPGNTYRVSFAVNGYLQRGWGWSQEVLANSPVRIYPGQTSCTKGGNYAQGDIVMRPSQRR